MQIKEYNETDRLDLIAKIIDIRLEELKKVSDISTLNIEWYGNQFDSLYDIKLPVLSAMLNMYTKNKK